jgi:hypothetical protein
MGVTEYQERRRKAVSENLARLAFVVSDVVMFIWNESFANASYMQRVRRLAYESTEVDSTNKTSAIQSALLTNPTQSNLIDVATCCRVLIVHRARH